METIIKADNGFLETFQILESIALVIVGGQIIRIEIETTIIAGRLPGIFSC
jgi:hypothetical protein